MRNPHPTPQSVPGTRKKCHTMGDIAKKKNEVEVAALLNGREPRKLKMPVSTTRSRKCFVLLVNVETRIKCVSVNGRKKVACRMDEVKHAADHCRPKSTQHATRALRTAAKGRCTCRSKDDEDGRYRDLVICSPPPLFRVPPGSPHAVEHCWLSYLWGPR
jgi:hypothetical protein